MPDTTPTSAIAADLDTPEPMPGAEPRAAAADLADPPRPAPPRPRIRGAAIVWGVVLAALGSGAVWLVWTPTSADAAAEWLLRATPGAWVIVLLVGVLVIGAVILVGSLLGALRRAQERAR